MNVSAPAPPVSRSTPPFPLRVSLPPSPLSVSGPGPPTRLLGPASPTSVCPGGVGGEGGAALTRSQPIASITRRSASLIASTTPVVPKASNASWAVLEAQSPKSPAGLVLKFWRLVLPVLNEQ